MKDFKAICLFACAEELDWNPGHFTHRDSRTTPRITIDFGQDQAGKADLLIEPLCDVDGFLTSHRIRDEQHLFGLSLFADRGDLLHHVFVNLETTCCVDDHNISVVSHSRQHTISGDLWGWRGHPFVIDRYIQLT